MNFIYKEISISLEEWINMEICEFSSYTVLYLFSDYYLTLIHNFFYQEHNNITWDENFTWRIWDLIHKENFTWRIWDFIHKEISISLEEWLNMEICELSSYTVLYLFSDYYLTLTHNLFYQEQNNITWDENFTWRIWDLIHKENFTWRIWDFIHKEISISLEEWLNIEIC